MAVIAQKQPPITKQASKTSDKVIPQEMIVRSRFVRQAPDKIRLVGKTLVGKKATEALNILTFLGKSAAKPLILIVKEAISRAKDKNLKTANWSIEDLYIKAIAVNEGPKLKRRRIIHRGRSTNILKRMSHITIVLSDNANSKSKIRNPKQITNLKLRK